MHTVVITIIIISILLLLANTLQKEEARSISEKASSLNVHAYN